MVFALKPLLLLIGLTLGAGYHTGIAPTSRRAVMASNIRMGANAKAGIFSPAVYAAKSVLGKQELNELRAKVISAHSKVISRFVNTSSSPFGQIVIKKVRVPP